MASNHHSHHPLTSFITYRYKRVSEETYFFKMSKYADRLVAHIEGNPSFCEPESARNEILARLRAPEGLKDLCISRTTFSWGIRVPDGFDQKHIMYVLCYTIVLPSFVMSLSLPVDLLLLVCIHLYLMTRV